MYDMFIQEILELGHNLILLLNIFMLHVLLISQASLVQ